MEQLTRKCNDHNDDHHDHKYDDDDNDHNHNHKYDDDDNGHNHNHKYDDDAADHNDDDHDHKYDDSDVDICTGPSWRLMWLSGGKPLKSKLLKFGPS